MRDQTDCHYPHINLCLRDCEGGCRARKTIWRKRQIEEQQAEDEEFDRIAHSNTCKYKALCLDYPTHCPDCPSNA
jgi:hypothetical protein